MEIKCNQEKNKIIIAVIGRVDSVTAAEFEKKVTEILHKKRTIILFVLPALLRWYRRFWKFRVLIHFLR